MKLVLFGDMHLDSAFAWLGANPAAARARRKSLREALLKVTHLAAEENADALLCSGDLYEQDRVTQDAGGLLKRAFAQLSPMPVFISPGNYDYLAPGSIYRSTQWSDNVHIFEGDFRRGMVELEPGFLLWGTAHKVPANTHNFFAGFSVPRGSDTHVALAEHLAKADEPCPLLLDDVTVQSDSVRKKAILETLKTISAERQVVVFTQEEEVLEWAQQNLGESTHRIQTLTAAGN